MLLLLPSCSTPLPRLLQELFPGSDVARMVELAPALFLESPWPQTQAQLAAASSLLRRELQGADVDFMFQVSEWEWVERVLSSAALCFPVGRQFPGCCWLMQGHWPYPHAWLATSTRCRACPPCPTPTSTGGPSHPV